MMTEILKTTFWQELNGNFSEQMRALFTDAHVSFRLVIWRETQSHSQIKSNINVFAKFFCAIFILSLNQDTSTKMCCIRTAGGRRHSSSYQSSITRFGSYESGLGMCPMSNQSSGIPTVNWKKVMIVNLPPPSPQSTILAKATHD